MKLDIKLIGELNRDNYFKYLEADYSQRLVEQYKGEEGLFGQVLPTVELPADGQVRLEDYAFSQH